MDREIMTGSPERTACVRSPRGASHCAGIAIGVLVVVGPMFLWCGCATAGKIRPAAAPTAVVQSTGPVTASPGVAPEAPAPAATPATSPAVAPNRPTAQASLPVVGQVTILVESDPAGATIVVDGRPLGKAPLQVVVPGTALGFFRDYVEIRARFIAENESEESRTATEEFSPRDKVPAVLRFTPAGAQRTLR
jgi:hypothetical protein